MINKPSISAFFKEKNYPAILLIAINYFFLAKITTYSMAQFVNMAAIWPVTGLALAAALIYGNRGIVGAALGALGFYLDYFSQLTETWPTILVVAGFVASCSILELILTIRLIRRSLTGLIPETLREVGIYITVITLTSLTPTLCTKLSLPLLSFVIAPNGILNGLSSWVADVTGMLIVAPLLLACSRKRYRKRLVFMIIAPCLGLSLLSFGVFHYLDSHFIYTGSVSYFSHLSIERIWNISQADVFLWLAWIAFFCGTGITLVIGLYLEKHRLEQERLRKTEKRLKRHNQALAHLTHSKALSSGDLDTVLKLLTETSASTLNVERVCIWLFNHDLTEVRCADLYELSKNHHSLDDPFCTVDYPSYFTEVLKSRHVTINSAKHNPIMQEFEDYLKKLNIAALLDAPIHFGNEFVGVFCHENIGAPRRWTSDEQLFVGSMADLAALAIEVNKRQAVESALRISNLDLEDKVHARTAELSALNTHLANEIVERKQINQVLKESELRLRLATQAANVGVWECAYKDGAVVYSSEWKRQLGYEVEEIGDEHAQWEDYLHPDDKARVLAENQAYLEGKKPAYVNEFRLKQKDGSYRWIYSRGEAIDWDQQGKISRILGCYVDITKLKKTEENLRIFRWFAESAGQGMVIAHLDGRIIYQNPMLINLLARLGFNHDAPELLTRYYSGASEEKLNHEILPKLFTSGQWIGELELGRSDAQRIPTLENFFSVNDESDRPQFIANIITDISQQKEIELHLLKAKEAAETADRAKSIFIASMSHELRTPLNSIIGFTGLLLQGLSGELNPTQEDQLKRVSRSAKHLFGLITDIIDISKIETNHIDVYAENIDVQELVKHILEIIKEQAQDKGLTTKVSIPNGLQIYSDRKRLTQCIINLLTNAVKYTEKGSIQLTVSSDAENISFAVQDTGIGIAPEQLTQLFLPFERLESNLRTKTPGTGLGLYLTQKIANDLLAGSVSVTSKPGLGSCFTLKIAKQLPTNPIC